MSHSHFAQTLLVPGIARPTLRQQLAGDALTGLLAWWNAEEDVYSDTGLTTRATDGAAVAGWSDQSANAYHVTQSTAGDRPLWRASVAAFGGKPTLEYVSSDVLTRTVGSSVLSNLNEYTVAAIFATTSPSGNSYIFSEDRTVSSTPFVNLRTTAGLAVGSQRDDASALISRGNGTTVNDGKVHLAIFRRNGTTFDMRLDGVSSSNTATIGASTTNRLNIGAHLIASQYMTGHIAQVLLYNTDNYATIEPILRSYYGIA